MKSIYVGCSLKHAPEKFVQDVERFKDALRSRWHVLDFVGRTVGTDKLVFEHDLKCVREADFFIAIQRCHHSALASNLRWRAMPAFKRLSLSNRTCRFRASFGAR